MSVDRPGPAVTDPPLGPRPGVGVIMPILNEERHLEEAVTAVLAQDLDGVAGSLDVVLAVGPSSDRTEQLAQDLAAREPRVHVVPNPGGRTPDALNAAIAALPDRVEVVVRVDGHGILSAGYVATACRVLQETGAANVGGIMDAQGVSAFERAVAAAMTSRLGVGASRFHTGGAAGPVDTVYLGVFRRSWLERIGGFDTRFTRTQDWELNHRIRAAGGTVWFSPDLRVVYRPRATVGALSRQYLEYGRWRRVVARRHPGTLNLRYLAAPAALVGSVVGLVGGVFWWPLFVLPAGYATAVLVGGLTLSADLRPTERLLVPVVLPTMHLSWAWGFLTSRIRIEPKGESPA